jgi:hypothetical protein
MRSIYLQSFMLIPLVVSKLCPGQEKGTDGRKDGRTRRRLYALPKVFEKHNKTGMCIDQVGMLKVNAKYSKIEHFTVELDCGAIELVLHWQQSGNCLYIGIGCLDIYILLSKKQGQFKIQSRSSPLYYFTLVCAKCLKVLVHLSFRTKPFIIVKEKFNVIVLTEYRTVLTMTRIQGQCWPWPEYRDSAVNDQNTGTVLSMTRIQGQCCQWPEYRDSADHDQNTGTVLSMTRIQGQCWPWPEYRDSAVNDQNTGTVLTMTRIQGQCCQWQQGRDGWFRVM